MNAHSTSAVHELVLAINERFKSLALSDPAMLVDGTSDFHEDTRARAVVDTALAQTDIALATRVRDEFFGVGPLARLVSEPDVTEIIVNGPDSVWFERNGRLERLDDRFHSDLTYRNFLMRISREASVLASLNHPFADGHWGPFRMHLIVPPASAQQSVLTLRRHPENPWMLAKLEDSDWASPEAITCLRQLIERKANFLIVGSTGSGKTSVLNACLQELEPMERVILIEDTHELTVPNEVSTKLLTRKDAQGLLCEVDQGELLKQSLRMRPDRIVMGEIRGTEARDLLMAFATGHSGCMGTLHADSARQALLRLEMLIQLGTAQWSLSAVRTLILLSLQAIVVVRRSPDGKRRLEGIYSVSSLEEVGFLLEKLV